MLQVMISSTFRDLRHERTAVHDAIDKLAGDGFSINAVAMEKFGSIAATPFDVSTGSAENADLIVLLLASSYGSVVPDRGVSFTEAEYDAARRLRIPILAYLQSADESELPHDIAGFRHRVCDELTTSPFSGPDSLVLAVERDLRALLQTLDFEKELSAPMLDTPPITDLHVFEGRKEELEQLQTAMELAGVRVGIWGPAGVGKTTLVQWFIREFGHAQYDPIWLRMDDLFGRDEKGGLRIGAVRWSKETLLNKLTELCGARPRALLIFDNVHTAPLSVGWLAGHLGGVKSIFLSQDASALPFCGTVLRLRELQTEEAKKVLQQYCDIEQAGDTAAIDELSQLLENYPLMLTLAGRKLQANRGKQVRDMLRELAEPLSRLHLEGPSIDRPKVIIQEQLRQSYHVLDARERVHLSALAALPSRGISENSAAWLVNYLNTAESSQRLDAVPRAVEVGLIEQRRVTDWRGHRYRMRSIIADFLRGTDQSVRARQAVEAMIDSDEALRDSSLDVVVVALQSRLQSTELRLPAGWALDLLVNAREVVREAAKRALKSVPGSERRAVLAQEVANIAGTPRSEDVMLALLELLQVFRSARTQRCLEDIWQLPEVTDSEHGTVLLNNVRAAAGRALAAVEGLSFGEFLRRRLTSSNPRQVIHALDVVPEAGEVTGLEPVLLGLFEHPNPRIRKQLAYALMADHLQQWLDGTERLVALAEKDPDEQTRITAMFTLGVRGDRRVLNLLLDRLRSPLPETRAEVCSVLWRYRLPEVADALFTAAARETDANVSRNIAFVLADFQDERAGELVLRLLRSQADENRRLGAFFAGLVDADTLAGPIRQEITDVLAERIHRHYGVARTNAGSRQLGEHRQPDAQIDAFRERMNARKALLHLHDDRGHVGLWEDLCIAIEPGYRAMVVQQLASWVPSGFEPWRLRPLLHDDSPDIRATAALVAGQLKAAVLIDELQLLLEDGNETSYKKTVAVEASEALDRISGKRPPWEAHRRQPVSRI